VRTYYEQMSFDTEFKIVVYKCDDTNCSLCEKYDQVNERGVCSECIEGFYMRDLNCIEIT